MSIPSHPFHSLPLKLPNKGMDFPFPPLKLPNKGREEYYKIIFFHSFPFHSLVPNKAWNWEKWEGMDLGLMKFLLKSLKYPFNTGPFFSHSTVKKYSYNSCMILSVIYKVKLLLLINIATRYSLTATSFISKCLMRMH